MELATLLSRLKSPLASKESEWPNRLNPRLVRQKLLSTGSFIPPRRAVVRNPLKKRCSYWSGERESCLQRPARIEQNWAAAYTKGLRLGLRNDSRFKSLNATCHGLSSGPLDLAPTTAVLPSNYPEHWPAATWHDRTSLYSTLRRAIEVCIERRRGPKEGDWPVGGGGSGGRRRGR